MKMLRAFFIEIAKFQWISNILLKHNHLTNSRLFGEETTGKDLGFLLEKITSIFNIDHLDLFISDLGRGRLLAIEDL
jgi:hypothetical protein